MFWVDLQKVYYRLYTLEVFVMGQNSTPRSLDGWYMIPIKRPESNRIDHNRLPQMRWNSRFYGFPEAAGAAVRALAGPPCSQRCTAVSNSGWCTTNRDRSFAVRGSICFVYFVWKQNDGLEPWALSTYGGRWDSWFLENLKGFNTYLAIYMLTKNMARRFFVFFYLNWRNLPLQVQWWSHHVVRRGHSVWLRSDADALGAAFQAEQRLGTAGNRTSKCVQSSAENLVGNIAHIDWMYSCVMCLPDSFAMICCFH